MTGNQVGALSGKIKLGDNAAVTRDSNFRSFMVLSGT